MKRVAIILGAAAVLAASGAAAADTPRVFTNTSNAHACVVHGGGILAGTDGGLVELDRHGAVLGVLTAYSNLGGTRVYALYREGDRLIIGTERGLTFAELLDGRVTIQRHIRSKPVRAIAKIANVIYVGTWGGGLHRLGPHWIYLTPVGFAGPKRKGRERITSIVEHDGAVHVGTAGAGVYVVTRLKLTPRTVDNALVWSLASRNGKLYAGTVDGLALVAGDRLHRLGAVDVRALAVDGRSLRVGTFGEGAFRYRGRLHAARLPTRARVINAFGPGCVATRDGVWFRRDGTWTAAANIDAPASNDISAIAADGDKLWVGTFDQGLSVLEGGRWKRFEHPLLDRKINALAVSGDTLWVATATGLTKIRRGRVIRLGQRAGLPSKHIFSVTTIGGGRVLVGTSQGAAIIDGDDITPIGRKQGVLVGNVWAAAADTDGYIWLGSTKGLYRGKPGGTWERYSLSTKHLRDDWVMAIAADPTPGSRRVWVGTYKGGVVRFDWTADKPGELAATPLGEGWINPGGLTWAGGKLYAATMEGLRIGDGADPAWQRHTHDNVDTTGTVVTGDRLWVATRRGLIRRER